MSLSVLRAGSIAEVVTILGSRSGARFLAGGTLLVRDVNAGNVSIDLLVLSDDLGLDRIVVGNGRAELGSAATMAAVSALEPLALLNPVADSIGGPAIRAMATVGGNLFAPYPYGDFAVALLALGADVTVESRGGSETIDLGVFLSRRGSAPPAVVRSVGFQLPPAGAFRFVKVVRRKPHGASVLSIAAVLPLAERKVSGARLAYGALAATPMRALAVERVLEGQLLDQKTIAAAIRVAADGCKPLSDPQASDWYRLKVLPVHLKRLLES